MAGETTRKTTARRGRTVAAVDKDLKALKADVSNLQDGVDSIVQLLQAQAAQQVNEEVQANVQWTEEPAVPVAEYDGELYDEDEDFDQFDEDDEDFEAAPIDPRDYQSRGYARAPKKKKSRVGNRNGDKIIRNIRSHQARFRIGNPRDPFRVILEARGAPGDTDQIPASLVNDINYKRNLNKVFEEISEAEYDALQSMYAGYATGGFDGGYIDAELVQDRDRTVATMVDVSDPRSRGLGPRYVDAVGADVQRNAAARQAQGAFADGLSQDDQAELVMLRRRQQGLLPPDPSDPSGRETMARLKRRQAVSRTRTASQLAGNDRESQIMAQRIAQLEGGGRAGRSKVGVLPEGELGKPVSMVRGQMDVVTSPYGIASGAPSRRLPTENVPQVQQRRTRG